MHGSNGGPAPPGPSDPSVGKEAPDVLDLMRDLLQAESCNVTTTNHVPNTFARVTALQPDAVVLDLATGPLDG